jgi:molybdopterin molybdotransferase
MSLRSPADALADILAHFAPLPAETVRLEDAYDRVLAEDVVSAESLPPFANSSMDGFAVRAADVGQVPARLRVTMDIPAGSFPEHPLEPGEAARIMTGAPVPDGADAIVPVEDTDADFRSPALPDTIQVRRAPSRGAYIRPIGEDVRAGAMILARGTVLGPAEVGMLASVGRATVNVTATPRAVVLSSGDELLGPDEPLAPGKIRDANTYTLTGMLRALGVEVLHVPRIRDTLPDALMRIEQALAKRPHLLVSSGGVSVGAFDVMRQAIESLGGLEFWKVNLRPGKPLAFGHVRGVPFFGLPGNPVSAMVTCDVFVRPAVLALSGREIRSDTVRARVGHAMQSDGRQTYTRVTLERRDDGDLVAHETGTQSSGALSSMIRADGLLIIPEGITQVSANDFMTVRLLRPLRV